MGMKTIEERIKEKYPEFTKTQKLIANYVVSNQNRIPNISAQEIARELYVSDASIIRFSRALGYSGFTELKNDIKEWLMNSYEAYPRFERLSIHSNTDGTPVSMYEKIGLIDVDCLRDFYENFDRTKIDEAVKQLHRAQHIHVMGFGADNVIAIFFNHYLTLMGYDSICYTDGGFLTARNFSNVKKEDVIILFATPPALTIEKPIIEIANKVGAYSIYAAPDENLEIGSRCNLTLNLSSKSLVFMNSYVTYFSLCNMLIMGLYENNKEEISYRMKRNDSNASIFELTL